MTDGRLEYYWVIPDGDGRPIALKKKAVLDYLAQDVAEGFPDAARGVGGPIDMLPPVQLDPESPRSREQRFQYHERQMLHHTTAVMQLRPGQEPARPSVEDLQDAVKAVIKEAAAIRGTLESVVPTTARGLLRALNVLDGVESCDRCAFARPRHAGYCNGPAVAFVAPDDEDL